VNYIEPKNSNLSVTENDVFYTMKYYKAPETLSGVTPESYPDYDAGTTYTEGDYCIVPELKGIYRSADNSNTANFPPANPTQWVFWGPINPYKMLAVDEFIGTKTTGTDIVMTYDFSGLTSFALLDIDFSSVLIEIEDDTAGTTIYSKTFTGTTYGSSSYYEYFYLPLADVTDIIEDNIQWTSNATLTITFTDNASIGTFVLGIADSLGCTLEGSSLKFEDKSTIQTSDITGFRTVTRYGNIRIVNVNVLIQSGEFNNVARVVNNIIGHNILFIPTDEDKFSESITIGYFETFEMPMNNDTMFESQAVIIGVI